MTGTTGPIGQLDVVAFDGPDPMVLAEFYRDIVGGAIVEGDGQDWVELHTADGRLAFQQVADHRPPTWPDTDVPQQAHVDIRVEDLDAGEAAVLDLGATKAEAQPRPDSWRVFLDPAGHPFCLVRG